jgi:uncharacterized protein (TIGR02231 family)
MSIGRLAAMAVMAATAAGLAGPAGATEVPSKPAEVTVYPQGARIIRRGVAKFPAGPQIALFPDLPASADEASLRLSLKGPAGTKLYGVRLRSAFTAEATEARIRDLQRKIQAIEDRKADAKDRITGRNLELEILKSLGKDAAARAPGAGPQVQQFTEGAKQAGKRIAELLAENRMDERLTRDLDEEAAPLRRELQLLGQGRIERRTAEAELELPQAGEVAFELSYLVSDAGWSPRYDLRLDTTAAAPKVGIGFAAAVRQRSGEDWDGVRLILSTARPTAGTAIPDPTNWWLDLYKPPVVRPARSRAPATLPSTAADSPQDGMLHSRAADEPVPVGLETSDTVRAEFAAAYAIRRPATIPGDGSERRVGIAEGSHDAKVLVVVVPRLAQSGFVEATVTYGGEETLLPGPAQLFHDDEFVGHASVPPTGPGDELTLGFGLDGHLKVERKLEKRSEADGGGLFGLAKGSRHYRWVTTLRSSHRGVRTVEVREQLPRSRHEKIVVEAIRLSPDPLPEDPSQPGLRKWRLALPPTKDVKVVFEYRVKYPPDARVVGME